MDQKISYHRRLILITFSAFFFFASFIIGTLLIFFLITFGHDFKEPKCFDAIDKWYQENNIKVDYDKRWKQHLECEKNLGFFPFGKEAKFSK